MFKSKLTLLLGVLPVAAFAHALLIWHSLRGAAWPWIVNDLSYHLYVPFLMPAGLAAMIAAKPWVPLRKFEGARKRNWIALLGFCVLVGFAGGFSDVISRADEPYFYRDPGALIEAQKEPRRVLSEGWGRDDAELQEIRRAARDDYRARKEAGHRWSAAHVMHSAITLITSAAAGAAFWVVALTFAVGSKLKRQGKPVSTRAADAMTLAMALLILWFPARLYTEWHLHLYSLDQLHNFGMFFVVALVALFAVVFLILLRFSRNLVGGVSALSATASAATGLVALVKPEAFWYAWLVITGLGAIPWVILVAATAFVSLLIARLAHGD